MDMSEPVMISEDTSHNVTMFFSPDHSIQPLVDFIESAKKSIDLYIPGENFLLCKMHGKYVCSFY